MLGKDWTWAIKSIPPQQLRLTEDYMHDINYYAKQAQLIL